MNAFIESITFSALGAATGLVIGAVNLQAQERPPQGGFDPARMRQRMTERLREQFEVQDAAEWKVISERIAHEALRQVLSVRQEAIAVTLGLLK
ncbi:MAG: hypothetical protein HY674_20190 [Chloroflexi bacterium]|nr:hypothetical protein [Chloroflexota bacterium]